MAIMTTTHGRRVGISAIVCALVMTAGCSHGPRLGSRGGRGEGRGLPSEQTAEIQVALGRSLEAGGDFDKAMSAYREAAKTAPKRPEPRLRMAILLDRMGRFAEAAPHYDDALKASPADAEIYSDRGYSLCLQGRDAEGEAALRQAIAIKPNLARAHNNLGAVLGRSGRTAEALAEFRKAGSPEADAELNLAFSLGQGRRWDEAKKHLEIAKRATPSAKEVGKDIAHLEALIARAETAKPTSMTPASDSAVMKVGGAIPGTDGGPAAMPLRDSSASDTESRRGFLGWRGRRMLR